MGSHTETTPEAFSEVAPSNGPTRLLSHFHIMGTDKRKSIGTENSMQSSPVPIFVVAERHENCIVTPFRLNNTAVVRSSIALTCNWSWSRVLMAMNISVMLMLPRPGLFLGRETLPGPCARSVSPKGIICPVVRVGIVVPRCGCYVAGNICNYVAGKLTWPHALSVATWIYPSGCCQVCSCADYVAWNSTRYILNTPRCCQVCSWFQVYFCCLWRYRPFHPFHPPRVHIWNPQYCLCLVQVLSTTRSPLLSNYPVVSLKVLSWGLFSSPSILPLWPPSPTVTIWIITFMPATLSYLTAPGPKTSRYTPSSENYIWFLIGHQKLDDTKHTSTKWWLKRQKRCSSEQNKTVPHFRQNPSD